IASDRVERPRAQRRGPWPWRTIDARIPGPNGPGEEGRRGKYSFSRPTFSVKSSRPKSCMRIPLRVSSGALKMTAAEPFAGPVLPPCEALPPHRSNRDRPMMSPPRPAPWLLLARALSLAPARGDEPPAPPRVYGEWLIRVRPDQGPAYDRLIEQSGLP